MQIQDHQFKQLHEITKYLDVKPLFQHLEDLK